VLRILVQAHHSEEERVSPSFALCVFAWAGGMDEDIRQLFVRHADLDVNAAVEIPTIYTVYGIPERVTPLMLAAARCNVSTVRLLLDEFHADPRRGSSFNRYTALHLACAPFFRDYHSNYYPDNSHDTGLTEQRKDTIRLLLQHGASIDGQSRNGPESEDSAAAAYVPDTPLMLACLRPQDPLPLVTFLCEECGATSSINTAGGPHGMTALHTAMRNTDSPNVPLQRYLLLHGAMQPTSSQLMSELDEHEPTRERQGFEVFAAHQHMRNIFELSTLFGAFRRPVPLDEVLAAQARNHRVDLDVTWVWDTFGFFHHLSTPQ
jgi:hypothetical protein